ncbi:MAG: hypothetical protein JWP97_4668 [Labilithrix sp.]|nr:hypothetical protein [Labilithrix sp.]
MSSSDKTVVSIDDQRARLETRANAIRSRLFRTMDALDNRRHQVTEVAQQAKKLAVPVAISVLGVAVLAAATAYALGAAMERRREKSISYRLGRALGPALNPPPARPSFWGEAARKIGMTALSLAATHLMKEGAKRLEAANGARDSQVHATTPRPVLAR